MMTTSRQQQHALAISVSIIVVLSTHLPPVPRSLTSVVAPQHTMLPDEARRPQEMSCQPPQHQEHPSRP